MKNILLVLSGPSGVGKGTMKARLMQSGEFVFSVSCTTRAPRKNEKDGVDYFYITREQFEEKIASGGFLEYDEHFGYYYGTLREYVEERLKTSSVLLDVDVVGALNVKRSYPAAVIVCLLPPTREALKQRLEGRGSEPESEILIRLARAEYELAQAGKFDYALVNDDVEETAARLFEIVEKEKNRI